MTFWVYILRCSDMSYYTGHTDNLEQRVGQHQLGAIDRYTAKRHRVQLVFSQEFGTREAAPAAELQIKPWSRAKKEALIRRDWEALQMAAKKKFGDTG